MPLNIKLLNLAYGIKKKNFVDFDFAGRHLEKMVTQNFRENTVLYVPDTGVWSEFLISQKPVFSQPLATNQ